MEKERVGCPGRAQGGGEQNKRRKRKREAERQGGSSRCHAAGPWPSPEPVSSCPSSLLLWFRAVVGALWLVSLMVLEERPGVWERVKACFPAGLVACPRFRW